MSESSFSIATFNANGIRARMHIILSWLKNNPIDCLLLQETKVQDKDFPKKEFEKVGLQVIFKGQKAYNGVAAISPHKMEVLCFGFGQDNLEENSRQLVFKIKGLTIVNSYIPQGKSIEDPAFEYKLNWFKRLRQFFETRFNKNSPIIWAGDMNVAPKAIDVYAPEKKLNHVCFHESVRNAFKKCKDWGFEDCFRLLHPEEPQKYTFFDYRIPKAVERKLGWRIDHILATKPLQKRLIECFIDLNPRRLTKPSDHTFLIARFNYK